MSLPAPDKQWWTCAELAEAGLPDLPRSRQGVEKLARAAGWRGNGDHARKRAGRGGGWEYNWCLLPTAARTALLAQANAAPTAAKTKRATRDEAWTAYEALTAKAKESAAERLRIIRAVEAFVAGGHSRTIAVEEVARLEKPSVKTIWNWFALIDGVRPDDRLAYLAPRHQVAKRETRKAGYSPEWFERLKSLYLNPNGMSFSEAYRKAGKLAAQHGWATLNQRTAMRRYRDAVSRVSEIYAREGAAGLARCYPPQTRDRTKMVAMEGVNADCHKLDLAVIYPGHNAPKRVELVAFADIYSGMILSWRLDWSPNKVAVMAAFGDMVQTYPRKIRNYNAFVDGVSYAGRVTKGELPELKLMTADHRGGGMDAAIEQDMGMEKMSAKLTFAEHSRALTQLFGTVIPLTLRAGAQGETPTDADSHVYTLRGRVGRSGFPCGLRRIRT